MPIIYGQTINTTETFVNTFETKFDQWVLKAPEEWTVDRQKPELDGKTCVVTGAGSGIGRGIALAMAENGAKVAVLDVNEAGASETVSMIKAAGGRTVAIHCDTSDESSVQQACDVIAAKLGAADILVNNAAIFRTGALEDFSLSDWNAMVAVNFTGYFLCSKTFAKAMIAAGKGTIVNIASLSAIAVVPNMGPYSAAKAAVTSLTKQMAVEWGPKGIRCNTVHPGMVETPATAAAYENPMSRKGRENAVPLGRVGTPNDIAEAVAFLASDRAAYINGAEITIDGGFGQNLIGLVPRLPSKS